MKTPKEHLASLRTGFCFSMEKYLRQPHKATHISPQQLLAKINQGEKMFLLDVRQPEEFTDFGYITGAINIPVHEVAERVSELPPDLAYPIIVICESGARSAFVTLYLSSYGFIEVKNLEFGMREWRSLGYPLAF